MTKELIFTDHFREYASEEDSIIARVSLGKWITGLRLVATLYRDDSLESPVDSDDGFWPSLDPESAGYIGAKSATTLARHMAKAHAVLTAWNNDEWFYCGVAVRAWFDDIPLTDEFAHALWGVECNYPRQNMRARKHNPNQYLREVANDLASECAQEAIRVLTAIVEAGVDE